LHYGGDAIGGLVIIEPVTLKKDTLFWQNNNGNSGLVSSSIHKVNDLGWSWNALATLNIGRQAYTGLCFIK
jgi:iron complex outermembrane receptor protein